MTAIQRKSSDVETVRQINNDENTPPEKSGLSNLTVFFLFFLVLGLIGIVASNFLIEPYKHLLRDVAVTVSAISSISLVYEFWLRKKFVEEMRQTVDDVIREQMPSRYSNMRDSGIVDAYERLDREKLIRRFKNLRGTTIRIHKIFMLDLDDFESVFIDVIKNRDCEVEIMLLNPESKASIEKRVLAVPYRKFETYVSHINMNIEVAESIYRKLPEDKRSKFRLRLHDSFVGVSMIGWKGELIVGLYLQGRSATDGTQLKVTGESHFFYHELLDHFEKEWEKATPYPFPNAE